MSHLARRNFFQTRFEHLTFGQTTQHEKPLSWHFNVRPKVNSSDGLSKCPAHNNLLNTNINKREMDTYAWLPRLKTEWPSVHRTTNLQQQVKIWAEDIIFLKNFSHICQQLQFSLVYRRLQIKNDQTPFRLSTTAKGKGEMTFNGYFMFEKYDKEWS